MSPTPKSVKLAIYGWTLDGHSGVGRCPILGRWIPAFAGISEAFSSFVVPCPGIAVNRYETFSGNVNLMD